MGSATGHKQLDYSQDLGGYRGILGGTNKKYATTLVQTLDPKP